MRRISLALALIGAVAAAGCSGGAKSSSDSGRNPGVPEGKVIVTVTTIGGVVDLTPETGAAVSCGPDATCTLEFPLNTNVTVTANAGNQGRLLGWAGDCQGWNECVLTGNADKYVVVSFGDLSDATGHPNWSNGVLHGQMYNAQGPEFPCKKCHGANLEGKGIAVSCTLCHPLPDQQVGPHSLASGHNTGNNCSRCHSGDGFQDFIGVDGTDNSGGTGDYATNPPATSGVNASCSNPAHTKQADCEANEGTWTPATVYANGIGCDTCHNDKTVLGGGTLNQHRFPSGKVVTMDGITAICSQCHDGGRPTYEVSQVKKQLTATPAATSVDSQLTATDSNKTVRAHYVVAASTLFGSEAAAYYQFEGNIYTARNEHGGKGSCVDCHDAHTGNVKVGVVSCGSCHFDELTGLPVRNIVELEASRQFGYEGDIDGDGNDTESLRSEINGLGDKLYAAIRTYATKVALNNPDPTATICYYNNRFYKETDSNVACGTTPNNNEFAAYTPRLLVATYNYNMFLQDAGAWAHNPRYVVEILFDTINDLNDGLVTKGFEAAPNGNRAFNGHFGGAEDASQYSALVYHAGPAYWGTSDTAGKMGFTSAACYQCHGGKVGLDQFLASPATGESLTTAGKVNAFQCSTCHVDAADMKGIRSDVATLYFPPAKAADPDPGQLSFDADDLPKYFALCSTCHSGRENGKSVDNAIAANYALSATGLVVKIGTTKSVTVVAPEAWKKNRYLNAKVTFTSGTLNGTTVMVAGPADDVSAGGDATLTWAIDAASAPAANDTFNVTFDDTTWGIGFVNPHYLGAAGVLMGTDANMLYEYGTNTYAGKWIFWKPGTNGDAPGSYGSPHGASCVGCHDPKASKHTFEVDMAYCTTCHYAGHHPLIGEGSPEEAVNAAADELYEAIQTYAASKGIALCYNGGSHPYWFFDDDSDGSCATTTQARLDYKTAKAAFNFKWAHADKGSWAHNEPYVLQALYDSIVDLGGTPTFEAPNRP